VDFSLSEAERDLADLCRDFAQKEIATRAPQAWEEARCPTDLLREMGELGLLGMLVPEEWGGIGMSTVGFVAAMEQIGLADQSTAAAWQAHVTIGSLPLLLFGNDDQRERWLRPLAEGRALGAFGLTEPDAGSDARGISTRAEKVDGGWVINGAKTFISNGQIADLIVVVAKTDPSEGAKGVSLFVVEPDQVEGFRRGRKLDKVGLDAQDTSELFFDDVWVPADNLLGLEEGKGFYQLMAELPRERLLIAIGSAVAMERALEETIAYVKDRKAFGQPVISFQNSQFVLADCKAKAVVARVFVNDCIEKALRGALDLTTSAIAKLWVTEAHGELVDACLQLHGGYGYINDYPIARMWRDARVQRIYGGSSEIMKLLIARSL